MATFWLFWSASLVATIVWHAQRVTLGWAWTTGDWLISLSGGPVRRGLSGEFVYWITPQGLNPSWTVAFIQLSILSAIFLTAGYVFLNSSRSWTWFMITMSPAFLLFFPLSPEGSLRKESIAVACAGLLAVAIIREARPEATWVPVLVFSIACFFHEAIALSSPAILVMICIAHRRKLLTKSIYVAQSMSVLLASVSSLIFALVAPGNDRQVALICDRAMSATQNSEICDGAISAIGMGLRESLGTVSSLAIWNVGYLSLAILALVPMTLLRVPRRFWLCTLLVYAVLSPLFVIAWDYGRWIFLATSLLTFLAAVLERRSPPEIKVPMALALAFVALWSLPTLSLGQPSLFARVFELFFAPFAAWMDARY